MSLSYQEQICLLLVDSIIVVSMELRVMIASLCVTGNEHVLCGGDSETDSVLRCLQKLQHTLGASGKAGAKVERNLKALMIPLAAICHLSSFCTRGVQESESTAVLLSPFRINCLSRAICCVCVWRPTDCVISVCVYQRWEYYWNDSSCFWLDALCITGCHSQKYLIRTAW